MKKDGELQGLLAQHLDGDESIIARTLATHIGKESPLLRLLSPEESQGVIAALSTTVDKALQTQRDHVLRQFSLDDKESALSRLVAERRRAMKTSIASAVENSGRASMESFFTRLPKNLASLAIMS